MSAKPSPEEPNTTSATAAGENQAAPDTPHDDRPQADAGGAGPQPADKTEEQAWPAEEPSGEGAPGDARVAELEAQIADLTDRLLRAHAEMDNIRKRAEREKAEMAKYAISKFAGDIAVLSDNFQRAVGAVPAGAAEEDAALKALLDGVNMMEREFLNVLARYGVKRVDPNGQPFNPHLHQAIMEQQNPDVPSGTVVQVFQPGYTIEDRVLRPAMVVVAKGGPKAPVPEKPVEAEAQAEQSKAEAEGNGAAQPGSATE